MQIAKSNDTVYSSGIKVIDTGTHTIINGVPYDKQTNSPVPFNIVSIPSKSRYLSGPNCISWSEYYDGSGLEYTNSLNFKCNCTLVDSENPNITYVISPRELYNPSHSSIDNKDDSKATSFTVLNTSISTNAPVLTKITTKVDNSQSFVSTRFTIDTDSRYFYPTYFTQNSQYLFIFGIFNHYHSSGGDGKYVSIKIFDKNLNLIATRYINTYSLNNSSSTSYIGYQNGTISYSGNYFNCPTLKILYETDEGVLLFYNSTYYSDVSAGQYRYSGSRYAWFSFNSLLLEKVVSTSDQYYPYCIGNIVVSDHLESSKCTTTNSKDEMMGIPSKYTESLDSIYGYFYAPVRDHTVSSTSYWSDTNPLNWQLLKITHPKDNLLINNISVINLSFPEESDYDYEGILKLPHQSTYYNGAYYYGFPLTRYYWETFFTTINNIDYVHLVYKGTYKQIAERGIYTFKVNENGTEARFVSFYPALGGTLAEFTPLNEDETKIMLVTATSYHFLKFDSVSEKWVSTFDSLNKIKSSYQNAENKVYVHLADESIVCHDLNGAVIIDFDFEKTSYNYNNADIDSYISIWAKNSDDEYVASDIKLTIVGNCVWKANGEQTLATKTSASGPINIPFTIKGQTSINVGVDAII